MRGSKDDAANAGGGNTEGLEAYLVEGANFPKTFQQFDVGRSGVPSRAYEWEFQSRGRVEGSLIGRAEFPLDQYLDPHSRGGNRPKLAWPASPGKRLDAFFIEFRPAILEWPADVRDGEAVEALAQITAFEHDGVPFAYGTCRRTMHVKGVESIRAGGKEFHDAVRMEAATELTFGWLATIRVDETAWFARDVGLVQREERFNGRALWLFRFWGASRYELAGDASPNSMIQGMREASMYEKDLRGEKSVKGGSKERERKIESIHPDKLSRLAICLERAGRHIRLSGLAVEFGDDDSRTR